MRFLLGLLLLIVAGLGVLGAGRFLLYAISPADSSSQETSIIEIRRGQGQAEILRALKAASAISDERMFRWIGKLRGDWSKIKAGEYRVGPGMSPLEIFSILKSGVSVHRPLTIREGQNMFEIARDLQSRELGTSEAFLKLCRDPEFMRKLGFQDPLPPSLEGYLYPDTYFFNRSMSGEEMIREMIRHFNSNWTEADESRSRSLGLTRHEVVTLASIIEKETGAAHERALISSVFHNRLRKKMRLQSDPTTIYGIWERYSGNLRRSHLQELTPYNTYRIPALPVGPIGNPGRDAIDAALNPAQSDYLYFVSYNDGTHAFSKTYAEHHEWVRKLQMDPKARAGKSWRDQYQKERQHRNVQPADDAGRSGAN